MALGHSAAEAEKIVKTGSNTPLDGSWLKMHLGDPGDAGTASPAVVATRKQVSLGAYANGSVSNDVQLVWTNMAASEDPSHYSLWTDENGGTFLFSGLLEAGTGYVVGNTFTIDVGGLTITQTTVAS